MFCPACVCLSADRHVCPTRVQTAVRDIIAESYACSAAFCQNGGWCVGDHVCDCNFTSFEGPTCEIGELVAFARLVLTRCG